MSGVKCLKHWPRTVNPLYRRPSALRTLDTAHHVSNDATKTDDQLLIVERQALNPERAETCQFGTDDEVARHKSPYDPSTTTVESEISALREEYKLEGNIHDPLLVSPANLDVSRPLDLALSVPMYNLPLLGSVKGCTNKNKKVLLRTEPYVFRTYEDVFYKYIMSNKNLFGS